MKKGDINMIEMIGEAIMLHYLEATIEEIEKELKEAGVDVEATREKAKALAQRLKHKAEKNLQDE